MDVDEFRLRLVGKSNSYLSDVFLNSNRAVSKMIIDTFPHVIKSILAYDYLFVYIMLFRAIRYSDVAMFMFLIDNVNQLDISENSCAIYELCKFVLQHEEIPIEYVIKVFQSDDITESEIYIDVRNVSTERLLIVTDAMSKRRNTTQLAILFECIQSKCITDCISTLIIKQQGTVAELDKFLSTICRYSSNNTLTRLHYKAIKTVANKLPEETYYIFDEIPQRRKPERYYIDALLYTIALLPTQEVFDLMITRINNFNHYNMLFIKGTKPQRLTNAIIRTLVNDEFHDINEMYTIAVSHHARGYSLFETCYSVGTVQIAMMMRSIDDNALEFLKNIDCREYILNKAPHNDIFAEVLREFHA